MGNKHVEGNMQAHVENTVMKTREGFLMKGSPKMKLVLLVH